MTLFGSCVFSLEIGQDVAHTQTVAAHLVGICGANALARRADFGLALGGFIGLVQQTVSRQDEVCFLRDEETLREVVAALSQFLSLFHEEQWVEHHAVADDVQLAALENARWDAAQHVFLTVELQRVAGVRTALKACHNVVARGQYIDHLAFALVAPLEAEEYIYF